jgi:putative ABC transport system substrate-binding protein
MPRRAFLAITAGGLLAGPLAAEAQQASTVKIGWLAPEPKPFALAPFRQALKESGWIEGGNLVIEARYSHGAAVRYRELAAELVRIKVDAMVTDGTPATRAAQQATATIPIVFVSSNPVEQGFAESLSRPGKNLTGVAIIAGELNPKRIEFLKKAAPGMARLAILEDQSGVGLAPTSIRVAGNWPAIEAASRQLGIALMLVIVQKTDGLDRAFALAVKERVGGILVLPSAFFASEIPQIVALAARYRLPAMYEHRAFIEAGGLMSYGPDHGDMSRRLAVYVDKILKGTKPADLPIEQPTQIELVINLKTAKALGLTIPPSLLQRADQVIE